MTQTTIITTEGYFIAAIEGAIVLADSQQLKEEVKAAIEANGLYRVIIDLTAVDFIDSSGLGVLIGWFKLVNQSKGHIAYVGLSEYVHKIIALAKLDKIFPLFDTVEAAAQSF